MSAFERYACAGPVRDGLHRRRGRLGLGLAVLAIGATGAALAVAYVNPFSAPAESFAAATAYLDAPLPSLRRAVVVDSAAAFELAVARARAGQTIEVRPGVTIHGEFEGFDRVVRGGTVKVVLDRGVTFAGDGGPRLPAVWLRDSGGWRIWGGTVTNRQGIGILVNQMPGPVVWTGFTVRDTADQCVAVYPTHGDVERLTLKGTAGTARPDLALDPHHELGTGQHAWNIADATGGVVANSTFAARVVDQATGAAVSIDTGHIGPNVVVYASARHVGFAVPGTSWSGDATDQVAGNVVQLWGASLPGSLDIRFLEGADVQGRLLETEGLYPGANVSHARVDYGRATGPILLNRELSRVAYNARGGIRLGNVQPRP